MYAFYRVDVFYRRWAPVEGGGPFPTQAEADTFADDLLERARVPVRVVPLRLPVREEITSGYLAPITAADVPAGRMLCSQCHGAHHWHLTDKDGHRLLNCRYCYGAGSVPIAG